MFTDKKGVPFDTMLTENVLNNFTQDELVELMALKLEEIKHMGEPPQDPELYDITRIEIDLIRKIIDGNLKP